jgi:RNA polymerase sigma-70 factor (ECF subfamily)
VDVSNSRRLDRQPFDTFPIIFYDRLMPLPAAAAADAVDALYRSDWGRIVATLIRIVGDFDLAEEVAQEAFTAAVDQWREAGVPEYPRAWVIQTARHKALDRIRRRTLYAEKLDAYASSPLTKIADEPDYLFPGAGDGDIQDDRLRLIFTCCHPALALEAQVALTLRTLCGLETHEIARAFLVPEPTMAQRLVRAKKKIRDARIPYRIPDADDIHERLEAVLTVVYLVFNEGYAATRGESVVRADLSGEAIRLGRLIRDLTAPRTPAEATGLLALMLLHDARREARVDERGDVVLLDDQDRTRWNRPQIEEALALIDGDGVDGDELHGDEVHGEDGGAEAGPFALQAAIAAVHCRAATAAETDWPEILRLYDRLARVHPSPVVALNLAAAVAMVHGPEPALALIDGIAASGDLDDHHLLHSARADMLRRLGRFAEAIGSYSRALELAGSAGERRFLEGRLREVQARPLTPAGAPDARTVRVGVASLSPQAGRGGNPLSPSRGEG